MSSGIVSVKFTDETIASNASFDATKDFIIKVESYSYVVYSTLTVTLKILDEEDNSIKFNRVIQGEKGIFEFTVPANTLFPNGKSYIIDVVSQDNASNISENINLRIVAPRIMKKPTIVTDASGNIKGFDTNKESTIKYVISGGMQPLANELVISTIDNVIVYQQKQYSYAFEHKVPVGTLTLNVNYKVKIRTFGDGGYESDYSDEALLIAFSEPVATVTNILNGTIGGQSETFTGSYYQSEGIPLYYYEFFIYDQDKEQIGYSGKIYEQNISWRGGGFENTKRYFVRLKVTTSREASYITDYIQFIALYEQPDLNSSITLKNDNNEGAIRVIARVRKSVGVPDNTPIYENDTWINLIDNRVVFDEGFYIGEDFVLQIWCKDIVEDMIFYKMQSNIWNIYLVYQNENIILFRENKINNIIYKSSVQIKNYSKGSYIYVKVEGGQSQIVVEGVGQNVQELKAICGLTYVGMSTCNTYTDIIISRDEFNNILKECNYAEGDIYSLDNSEYFEAYTNMEIKGSRFDAIRIDEDVTIVPNVLKQDNGNNTVFFAEFEGNLKGEIEEDNSLEIQYIRFKRRILGETKWETIKEIEYNKDIYLYDFYDRYVRWGEVYEYGVCPIIETVEGVLRYSSLQCNFEGLFLVEQSSTVALKYNLEYGDISYVDNIVEVETLYSEYPTIIDNNSNYRRGNVSALILTDSFISNDKLIPSEIHILARNIEKVLRNKKPKLMKNELGDIMVVNIYNVKRTIDNSFKSLQRISFEWVEIANVEDVEELKSMGLSY